MQTKIHSYTSVEPMLKVNAFIVETPRELILVDTTLTMTDSKALKQKADSLAKPLAGIILTHGHPDHIAGTYNISPGGDVPIYALPSVKKLMEDTEAAKHAQWSGMFGAEWIPKWIYPNVMVNHQQTVRIAGLDFTVLDIGSGGDCDANSIWLVEDKAFAGDFIYKNNHTYMNDGSILRWLANLEQLQKDLELIRTIYIGHGPTCSVEDMTRQRDYFMTYIATILKVTNGTAVFSDDTRKEFERIVLSKFPDYGCQFMVALSCDRVASELVSTTHH